MVAILFFLMVQSCGSSRFGWLVRAHPCLRAKKNRKRAFFDIERQHYFVELALTSGKAFPVITKLCFGIEKIKATTAEADMRASSP